MSDKRIATEEPGVYEKPNNFMERINRERSHRTQRSIQVLIDNCSFL